MGKLKGFFSGAEYLSLGISIVVAIALGVALGIFLRNFFGYEWLLWLGVFYGVLAAGLNIKKTHSKLQKDMSKPMPKKIADKNSNDT